MYLRERHEGFLDLRLDDAEEGAAHRREGHRNLGLPGLGHGDAVDESHVHDGDAELGVEDGLHLFVDTGLEVRGFIGHRAEHEEYGV